MAASEVPLNALLWPFPANWRSAVSTSYSYLTTIFESTSGKEQRRATRATPRLEIDFLSSALDAESQHRLDRFVFENQNARMIVPDFSRVRRAEVTSENSLTVDGSMTWAEQGAVVVIRPENGPTLVRRMFGLFGANLALETGIDITGPVRIYPAIYGRLDTDLNATQVTAGVKELQVGFSGLPGYQIRPNQGTPGLMFDGREVLTIPANWQSRSHTFVSKRTDLDYGKGRITSFSPIAFGSRFYKSPFLLKSREEHDALVSFYHRRMGRLKEFFAPTDADDLTILGTAGAVLRVRPNGATDLAKNPVDRAIRIVKVNGEHTLHKVTALALVGEEQHLTLDPPAVVAPSTVSKVSWLPLCRFASDQMTVTHQTAEVSGVELTVQTLPYVAASA